MPYGVSEEGNAKGARIIKSIRVSSLTKLWEIKAPNKIIYKYKSHWIRSSKNKVEISQKGTCV